MFGQAYYGVSHYGPTYFAPGAEIVLPPEEDIIVEVRNYVGHVSHRPYREPITREDWREQVYRDDQEILELVQVIILSGIFE